MSHLAPETFIDLIDGTVDESQLSHLQACDGCRRQLVELRATWDVAVAADQVPEPSPLFWERLSARVLDAVAAEAQPRVPWWRVEWSWRGLAAVGAAVAAVVLVVYLQAMRSRPVSDVARAVTVPAATSESPGFEPLPPLADDPSLGFVADLTSDLDLDAAFPELGSAGHIAADRALAELNADERLELRRLLTEELGSNATM